MMLYILGRVVCEGERGRGEEEEKQTERGRDGVREDGRLVDWSALSGPCLLNNLGPT